MNETDIREQLAAHLAGELDEPAASALQARIESEPWIGRLADEMAEMLVALGRVDQVTPPPGFADRLRAGLEAEIGHPLADPGPDHRVLASSGAAAATGWADAGPKGRTDVRRPGGGRAQRGRDRLRGALGVAAVIAVLAVAGVGVLARGGMFGGEDAADGAFSDQDTAELTLEAADEAAAGDDSAREDASVLADDDAADAAAAEEPADGGAADTAAAPAPVATEEEAEEEAEPAEEEATEAAADVPTPLASQPAASGSAGEGPVVLDLGAVADDDGAIGRAVGDHPAVDAVLGTPAAEAVERAGLYRDELLRGPAFADGTDPAACLTDTLDDAGADLVPAVAARIDLPGGPAVAYALVRAAGGDVIDTVDVWVLDLPGCGIDRVVQAVR